jgi:hypothetical protein
VLRGARAAGDGLEGALELVRARGFLVLAQPLRPAQLRALLSPR